jgi:hypothetical protein
MRHISVLPAQSLQGWRRKSYSGNLRLRDTKRVQDDRKGLFERFLRWSLLS